MAAGSPGRGEVGEGGVGGVGVPGEQRPGCFGSLLLLACASSGWAAREAVRTHRSGREDGRRRAFFALEKKETPRAACMHLRD